MMMITMMMMMMTMISSERPTCVHNRNIRRSYFRFSSQDPWCWTFGLRREGLE